MASLLPSSTESFHDREYWNRFFQERGGEAFEWYGHFVDLLPSLRALFANQERKLKALVIGCGNSDFSSCLYNFCARNVPQGIEIINVDFSETVIQEMREKYSSLSAMRWDIGDITDMRSLYEDNSFDIVFDKGALDAIFSANTSQNRDLVNRLFAEIDRVLSPTGVYYCVSLAEPFVFNTLIDAFFSICDKSYWSISVESISTVKPSLLLPFLLLIRRIGGAVAGGGASRTNSEISLFFDSVGAKTSTGRSVSMKEARDMVQDIFFFPLLSSPLL